MTEVLVEPLNLFQIDLVFAEPNFSVALLPWHNLLYWFTLQHLLGDQLASNPRPFVCTPMRADLYAVPVEYEDLWKIRSPLHNVEGFEMKHFDDIVLVRAIFCVTSRKAIV